MPAKTSTPKKKTSGPAKKPMKKSPPPKKPKEPRLEIQLLEDFSALCKAFMKEYKTNTLLDIHQLQYDMDIDVITMEEQPIDAMAFAFIRKYQIGFSEWNKMLERDVFPLLQAMW